MNAFNKLFPNKKPVIGVIHLMALPGSPLYDGNMETVYSHALSEAEMFINNGINAIIIENFRDKPFYPQRVPAETIAALTAISRDIVKTVNVPVGINVLRNDAEAAIAIATAVEAQFIRVNVHMNAVVSEQGIIQGLSHQTLRLRKNLHSDVLIFADVGVKHAAPLASRGLITESKDVINRGLADALIVSGELTGAETDPQDVITVKQTIQAPVLIGSGVTPDNIDKVYQHADGFIVGSYFKKDGIANNSLDESRINALIDKAKALQ